MTLSLPLLLLSFSCNKQAATQPCGPAGGNDDALVWQGRAPGPTFVEITDVLDVGDQVWVCTGVQGLVRYDPADPASLRTLDPVDIPQGSARYPRCQYLSVDDPAAPTRVLVAAHADETQPAPWTVLVDVSGDSPQVLASRSSDANTAEAAFFAGRVVVAAHDAGLELLDPDDLGLDDVLDLGENVHRVHALGDRLGVGTVDGQLILLDADLAELGRLDLGSAVQDIQWLGGDRAAVALGSTGVVLLDLDPLAVSGSSGVEGSATRLAVVDGAEHDAVRTVAVSTWTDVRIFDVTGDAPVLQAVEGVFDAGSDPRVLAVGAVDDLVLAGEWTGLHVYRWHADRQAPEITLDTRVIKVAADGQDQQAWVQVTDEGQLPLVVDTLLLPDGWTADQDGLELQPGESVSIGLTRAGTTQVSSDTLSICSNDPDEPAVSVALATGSDQVTVGDPAPDFLYPALNTGQSHGLSSQQGSVVMLAYFATF